MNLHIRIASILTTLTLLLQLNQTPPADPQGTAAATNLYLPVIGHAVAPPTPAPGEMTTVYPSVMRATSSGVDLINPLRGLHEWRDTEEVPLPETAQDEYQRYFWRDPDNPSQSLETSRGVYNFSAIEADIAAAAAKGKKFAFRIRAMASDASDKRYIPDYLSDCGWSYNGTFIPDWNRGCFLDNAANLMNALGARYNNDPRIAWMDIGLYGRWGEWAMSEGIYSNAPADVLVASDASLIRIVDMQLRAFPNVRKVMMVKTRSAPAAYALASSNQVGWRVDCLGKQDYFDFATNSHYADTWKQMEGRWKTAPVIAEFCNGGVEPTYAEAIEQARVWHIATVGNGNFDSWEGKDSEQRGNLITLANTLGYRYQIKWLAMTRTWVAGAPVHLAAAWENTGVTPHYERTTVMFRLYNPANGQVVWEAPSAIDLRALLPPGNDPLVANDAVTLAAGVRPGVYQLRIIVLDPAGYRKPLKLAIGGRQADGSYLLGNVTVR